MKSRDHFFATTCFVLLTPLSSLALGCGDTQDPPSSAGGGGATGAGTGGGGAGGFAGSAGTAGSSGGVSAGGGAGGGMGGGTSGAGGGTSGAGGGTSGAGSGSGPIPAEPTFNTLKAIIPVSCFGGLCHNLAENPLQLSVDDKLYTTLTTHMTDGCGPVVKPGFPQDSALIKLLKGPCGDIMRMPSGKCFDDGDEGCISPAHIAALEQWIANGAPQ
jgi:hypothetical protein